MVAKNIGKRRVAYSSWAMVTLLEMENKRTSIVSRQRGEGGDEEDDEIEDDDGW